MSGIMGWIIRRGYAGPAHESSQVSYLVAGSRIVYLEAEDDDD